MGKALPAYASPKAALTWANTFEDGEVSAVIPALPPEPPSLKRWLAAALAAVGAASAILGAWIG